MTPRPEKTVHVAVVQAGAVPFDTDACVDKAIRLIGEAAAAGAKVVLFPEAFIPGYPKGLPSWPRTPTDAVPVCRGFPRR